jgi:glycosyltransferase involved in cell wall biosynthesis
MPELISVIVPIYNVERYLEKCVDSIIAQTYRDLEIILCNDGSTDGCGAICDRYAGLDSRVRVVHKENGGLSDARNAGIEIARGSWYVFIDSDDFITPDTIERMHTAAVSTDSQIAVCNMIRIYDDGGTEPFYRPAQEQTLLAGETRFETLKQPSACNKLFRADLFEGVRFPKGKFYEDTFVYHILAHRAKNIVLTGHDGYFYLSRRESILGQPRYTDRYFDFIEAVHRRTQYLLEHGVPGYAQEACLSLYAAVSNGEKLVPKTKNNHDKVATMRRWYRLAYDHLMKCPDVGLKQRIRLMLLRYLPWLHSRLY